MKIKTTKTVTFQSKMEAVTWLAEYYGRDDTSTGLMERAGGEQACYYLEPSSGSRALAPGGHCAIGSILSYAGYSHEDLCQAGCDNSQNAQTVVEKMGLMIKDTPTDCSGDLLNWNFWGTLQEVHDTVAMAGATDGKLLAQIYKRNANVLAESDFDKRGAFIKNLRLIMSGSVPPEPMEGDLPMEWEV
ncbi:MAG: hypothetical protein Unbinned767contig1000_3 [Prokaryotic dsDNA virus sp.]|nr:MAG: hypothetical protein Unbinned767contig1000_3 [Prokaryotic dsDNA virus sp.]